jgi:hypothetical protein
VDSGHHTERGKWTEVRALAGTETYMVSEEALWRILAVTKSPDETSLLMQVENVATRSKNVITALRAG